MPIVMSIEAYEKMRARYEFYAKILEGIDDIKVGNARPFDDAMQSIRENIDF